MLVNSKSCTHHIIMSHPVSLSLFGFSHTSPSKLLGNHASCKIVCHPIKSKCSTAGQQLHNCACYPINQRLLYFTVTLSLCTTVQLYFKNIITGPQETVCCSPLNLCFPFLLCLGKHWDSWEKKTTVSLRTSN